MEPVATRSNFLADPLLKRRLAGVSAYSWSNLALMSATLLATGMSLIRFMAWLTVRGYLYAKAPEQVFNKREVLVYASHYDFPGYFEELCAKIQQFSVVIVIGVMLGHFLWELSPSLVQRMKKEFKISQRVISKRKDSTQAVMSHRSMLIQHDWPFLKCMMVLLIILLTFFIPARTDRSATMLDDPRFSTEMWLERSTIVHGINTLEGLPITIICLLAIIPIFAAHRMIVKLRYRRSARQVAGWCVLWFFWLAGFFLAANIGGLYEEYIFPYGYQVTASGKRLIGILLLLTNGVLLYAALRIPRDRLDHHPKMQSTTDRLKWQ